MAAFMAPRFNRQIFAVIDPSISDQKSASKNASRTLKYIGYEDTVVNHTLLVRDIQNERYEEIDLERRANASIMSKRFFTVQAIQHIESLTLNFADLDAMKQEYKGAFQIICKD